VSENYNQPLSYIRPTPEKDFPAELVVRRPNDTYVVVVVVTRNALMNLIDDAVKLVRAFDSEQERKTNGK
tara:strand:- start:289 stop:498 length:210 start_codon:yes stop_codon:yes gene_type:complete